MFETQFGNNLVRKCAKQMDELDSWKKFNQQLGKYLNNKCTTQMQEGVVECRNKFYQQFGKNLLKKCTKQMYDLESMLKFY